MKQRNVPKERIGENSRKRTKLNETSNLPDTEIKILVIRMLNAFKGRIDELSENINKSIVRIKKMTERLVKMV